MTAGPVVYIDTSALGALLTEPYPRTLDALHFEPAVRLDASAILTYDTGFPKPLAPWGSTSSPPRHEVVAAGF